MARAALLALAGASAAAALRVTDVQCPATCASDLDCSLNGVCGAGGVCQCDAAWTGPCCTALNLLPVPSQPALANGYMAANTSTWGGNIIAEGPLTNGSTVFHMWIAEMAPRNNATGQGSCGLTTWGSNSQIVHVTSVDSPLGPYARREVAVPVWSHNPIVREWVEADGSTTYVLWHIGSGAGGPPGDGYCAGNATSPCGEQSFDQCIPTPPPCAASAPGYACHQGYCSGDAAADGNCGNDIAEPALSCNSYATCAPLAAAACSNTSGCVSFGLSQAWGFGKAKLFSAGSGGLTPNSQWSTWVQTGHEEASGAASVAPRAEWDVRTRALASGRFPEAAAAAAEGDSCTVGLHYSKSLYGPWLPYTNATITPCGYNNPGPWRHPNGTLFFIATQQDMGLWRADDWRGPYTFVTSGACGGGEDPSLYVDSAGRFHCTFHRSPFSDPDIAIGHSYSEDGYTWYTSALPAANSSIAVQGYGTVVHGKRERPHLYMGADGSIQAFVTGVCINAECNPLPGGKAGALPGLNCSSAAQYYRCDANSPYAAGDRAGWWDRTYTLVQGVAHP